MKGNNHHTALLIFAERAKVATRKKLLSDPNKNKLLHDKLLRSTLLKAKRTGLPYYWISDSDQRGETFAQKLYHSIEDIFNLGYDRLIVMGSDTPQVSVQTILQAEKDLSEHTMAIGPAKDGGLYLMGLHKRHFEILKALPVPWQSGNETVFIQAAWLQLHASLSILPTLKDLDTQKDWENLWGQISHTSGYSDIFTPFRYPQEGNFHYLEIKQFSLPLTGIHLRAPPQ